MGPEILDALRDIHMPPPPAAAAGLPVSVVLLIGAGLTAGVVLGVWFWRGRRFHHRRSDRAALRRLRKGAAAGAPVADTCAALSQLLRRRALSRFRRERVASLVGQRWLAFLDRTGGGGAFTHGPGAVLVRAPFEREPQVDLGALFKTCERWLTRNA